MNLAPRTLVDWLKPVLQRFFLFGMQVTTEEAASDLLKRGHLARKQGLETTLESLDFADQLPEGDEYRKRAIALFKEATIEQTLSVQTLLKSMTIPSDVEGVIAAPFDDASTSGTPSLPESSVKKLEAEEPTQPKKRPRGRPKKDKAEGLNATP